MADPRKKKDDEEAGAFGTGRSIGRGLANAGQALSAVERAGQGTTAAALDRVTAPVRRQLTSAGNVGRGIASTFGANVAPLAFNPTPAQDNVARARPEVYGRTLESPASTTPRAAATPPAQATRLPTTVVTPTQARRPASPAQGAGAPAAAGGAAAPGFNLKAGDPNTITYDGVTKAVPGMLNRPGVSNQSFGELQVAPLSRGLAAAPVPAPLEAQQVRAPAVIVPRGLSGDLSGAEKERAARLSEIDSQLFRLGNANTRGKKQLLSDLLGFKRQLTGQRIDQATGLETRGAELAANAASEGARLTQRTGEGNADRQLAAERFNLDSTDRALDRTAENRRISRTLTGRDGVTNALRGDGTLTPLIGADGSPFQEQQDARDLRSLQVSPDAEFKALNDRLASFDLAPPAPGDEQARALEISQIQQRMQQLTGQAPAAQKPASLQEFMAAAKAANPGVSEAELRAYYETNYGRN